MYVIFLTDYYNSFFLMSMLYLAALVMIEKIIENLTLHNDKVIF